MKLLRYLAAAIVFSASPAWARVNLLEPWSPGFDADIPETPFNSALNLRYGNDARGVDLIDASYVFTGPLTPEVEAGAAWGFAALDSSGLRDDSGLTDLTLGAKYRVAETVLARPAKAVLEAGLSLPTGDPDNGLGAGGLGFYGGLGFTYPIQAIWAYAKTGLKYYTEGSGTRWGRVLDFSVGAEYAVDTEWSVAGDFRLFDHGRDKIDGYLMADEVNEAYFAPGGFWRPKALPVEFQASLLLGLNDDAFDFGLLLGGRF